MTKNREEQRTDRKHKIVLRKSKIININILNIDWELLLHIQFNGFKYIQNFRYIMMLYNHQFSSVQLLSCVPLFVIP